MDEGKSEVSKERLRGGNCKEGLRGGVCKEGVQQACVWAVRKGDRLGQGWVAYLCRLKEISESA